MRIRIASRTSDLARVQAYQVAAELKRVYPDIEIEFQFRESLGDLNQKDPLWQMPEKGVFTQDFYDDLIKQKCDLVVHSWKDLPIEEREGTEIIATLPRADSRDLLLIRKDRWPQAVRNQKVQIFSSSPRRAYNLESALCDLLPGPIREVAFESVRGNIPTRLHKLFRSDTDGLILAKAALDRLLTAPQEEFLELQKGLRELLSRCRMMVLPLSVNPAAAAQGALAIEIAKHRGDLKEIFFEINHKDTFNAVNLEREILKSHGGGCHQKIGVSHVMRPFGSVTYLKGLTDQGEVLNQVKFESTIQKLSPASSKNIWPLKVEEFASWTKREQITGIPQVPNSKALWIARGDALPQDWKIPSDQIVWTPGLDTWKKLARLGVWVWGSSDGLGEQEKTQLETLIGQEISWVKLTHEVGFESDKMEVLSTYRLIPQLIKADLIDKTHFFWTSGSQFLRAIERFPTIKTGSHSCGPGNTYSVIRNRLGSTENISVFLNHGEWLKKVIQ